MSFFKEFKEDFSQAMNELMPGGEMEEQEEELQVNTIEQEVDVKAELDKLENLFEPVKEPIEKPAPAPEPAEVVKAEPEPAPKPIQDAKAEPKPTPAPEPVIPEPVEDTKAAPEPAEVVKAAPEPAPEPVIIENPKEEIIEKAEESKEETFMNTEEIMKETTETVNMVEPTPVMPKEVSDEIAIITEGTSLTGNMESTGSIEIRGHVNGNVQCNGKLTVTGVVKGNATSAEFFADSAKIEGEINTEGTVKIGLGSVVIGNISATSAVIAGAIKGDIDVQGPVVVDTSAVVMGNIKSRSVQINNGAVIEGFCSQCYAEVDVAKLFD